MAAKKVKHRASKLLMLSKGMMSAGLMADAAGPRDEQ